MRQFLNIFLLCSSTLLFAGEQVNLSDAQVDNLGIQVGLAKVIHSLPLLDAPAKVIIPPTHEYIVSSTQSGLANQVNISMGDVIKKGQILATINSPELLALQQHHLKSINDLKLAKSTFIRDKKLYKEGVIADKRWLQTQASYQVFMAHLYETRQLLAISGFSKQAIANFEKYKKLQSQLVIRAPISGVVLKRYIKSGQRVDALAPLFQIANLQQLWLDINIPQQSIYQIKIGDRVDILGLPVTARIFLLGKSVDSKNQTVLVRAEIIKGLDLVRAGQTVNTKISKSSDELMFKVPNSALATTSGMTYIFVRTAYGFKAQVVEVLGREKQTTIISTQITPKDKIALHGAVALKANLLGLGGAE